MGCAPITHVLWSKIMSYNPANPKWVSPRPLASGRAPTSFHASCDAARGSRRTRS